MTVRHLLADDDLTAEEQSQVLDLAAALKADRHAEQPLAGPQAVAIIFDKPTLRTQVSFAGAISGLGGYPLVVDGALAVVFGAHALWAIVGATGTGKTGLSLDLAEALGASRRRAEIVNADAMQLYRGMDVGTAKVPEAEKAEAEAALAAARSASAVCQPSMPSMVRSSSTASGSSTARLSRHSRPLAASRISAGLFGFQSGPKPLWISELMKVIHSMRR